MNQYLRNILSRAWGLLLFRGILNQRGFFSIYTTSMFLLALCKQIGFDDIKYAGRGYLTRGGLKPVLRCNSGAHAAGYIRAAEMVGISLGVVELFIPFENAEKMRRDLVEQSRKALAQHRRTAQDVIKELEKSGRITTQKEAGMTPSKAAKRLIEAAEEAISDKVARKVDPVKHWAYGKFLYVMLNLLLRDPRSFFHWALVLNANWPEKILPPDGVELLFRELSESEFSQLLTTAIIVGGKVRHDGAVLKLKSWKRGYNNLHYDAFHKAVMWLALLAKYRGAFKKYGVDIIPSVHIGGKAIYLRFDKKAAKQIYLLGGGFVEDVYKTAESLYKQTSKTGAEMQWDRPMVKARLIIRQRNT